MKTLFTPIRQFLPLGLILLVGVALSALLFQMKEEAIRERHRAIFSEIAHEYARGFEWEMGAHLDAAQSLRDFLLASPRTDRTAFTSFARASLERGWAFQSLQWIPVVPAAERESMKARALDEGLEDFAFFHLGENGERVTAAARDLYYPVYYAEPLEESRPCLGFDYGSDPGWREAFRRATESGELVVTQPVELPSASPNERAILLLLPVFSTDETADRQVHGFVAAALDIKAIGQEGLRTEKRLQVEVIDKTEPDSPSTFFSSGSSDDAASVYELPFVVGGRQWSLVISATREALTPGAFFESWILLAGGLIFTGLAAAWTRQRQVYVHSVEAKVTDRTAALSRINDDLQNEMAQRRKAEQSLQQSETRFREAFLHAPTGIGLLSPSGNWMQVNQALTKITGFSEEEFRDKILADLLHPDEAGQALATMAQMIAGEVKTFALEHRFRHQTGNFIPVLVNVSQVRSEDSRLLYFIVQVLDITKRKQALEETRRAKEFSESIIRSSSDGIFAFDLEARVTVWNNGMEEMTGISAAEARGELLAEVLPFLAEPGGDQALRRILAGGTVRAAERPFSVPASGRSGYFAGHYAPLHDSDGGITGGVAVVRDVTRQRESRERLQAFTELLKQRNRELQDFAYVASHDLQEPLRKVRAFGDRLERKCKDLLDDQARDYLKRMQDAAGRMQTLINDLLAFSRITTAAHPFRSVDLGEIAQEVVSDLESRIEETGGTVEIGELPTIEADATQMRQLLQNLIGNGLKYHKPDTPPRISVFATKHAREDHLPPLRGTASLIHVRDNGIGFEEKYLDRIFTVFQRLHGRNEYPGTGVGLAICRKIAERHNGWITATSTPGEGSTFIAGLPHKQNHNS